MPNYILEGDDRVSIARRPVAVSIGGTPGVVLEARVGGHPDPGGRSPRPDVMILPRVEGRTVVRLAPAGHRGVFADGTKVTVRLQTEQPRNVEPDVVEVRAVDVSGLAFRDFLAVEPAGDRLTVTALGRLRDVPLGPLSTAARTAARARLGVDRADEPVDLVIAVDTSASMGAVLSDGSVSALVDMVTGLSHVIGWDRTLEVHLLGDEVTRLPDTPSTELAARTVAAMADIGFGTGFRSAPVDHRVHGVRRETLTYVLTDAVPADATALQAADRTDDARHLVLLGTSAVPASAVPDGLSCTALPPPPAGVEAGEHVLRSPALLADVVASLLVTTAGNRSGTGPRSSR